MVSLHLRVNPVACDGFGYCAELLPELVRLDEWGFPVVSAEAVPAHLRELARKAVADCPRRALVQVELGQQVPVTAPRRIRIASYRSN